MKKTDTNTAADITNKINNPDLAAAYKRILVTDNAVAGLYDITVEFIRKHGGSPWRRVTLVEGLKEEQTVAAACVLRKYCIEETRQVEIKDHLPNPDAKKDDGKAKKKEQAKSKAIRIVG